MAMPTCCGRQPHWVQLSGVSYYPPAKQALVVAWICVMVASLTKNEGFVTALTLAVLISLRYRPPSLAWFRRPTEDPDRQVRRTVVRWQSMKSWVERALFVVVPILPGLVWVGLVHQIGLANVFFGAPVVKESLSVRASATVGGMAGHLAVLPVALTVLVAGSLFLRTYRENLGLGNPLWLWASCLLGLAAIFATYLLGAISIHWWLQTSVDRTTIFPQIALYAELAIWLIVVFGEEPTKRAPPSSSPALQVGDVPYAGVSASVPLADRVDDNG